MTWSPTKNPSPQPAARTIPGEGSRKRTRMTKHSFSIIFKVCLETGKILTVSGGNGWCGSWTEGTGTYLSPVCFPGSPWNALTKVILLDPLDPLPDWESSSLMKSGDSYKGTSQTLSDFKLGWHVTPSASFFMQAHSSLLRIRTRTWLSLCLTLLPPTRKSKSLKKRLGWDGLAEKFETL